MGNFEQDPSCVLRQELDESTEIERLEILTNPAPLDVFTVAGALDEPLGFLDSTQSKAENFVSIARRNPDEDFKDYIDFIPEENRGTRKFFTNVIAAREYYDSLPKRALGPSEKKKLENLYDRMILGYKIQALIEDYCENGCSFKVICPVYEEMTGIEEADNVIDAQNVVRFGSEAMTELQLLEEELERREITRNITTWIDASAQIDAGKNDVRKQKNNGNLKEIASRELKLFIDRFRKLPASFRDEAVDSIVQDNLEYFSTPDLPEDSDTPLSIHEKHEYFSRLVQAAINELTVFEVIEEHFGKVLGRNRVRFSSAHVDVTEGTDIFVTHDLQDELNIPQIRIDVKGAKEFRKAFAELEDYDPENTRLNNHAFLNHHHGVDIIVFCPSGKSVRHNLIGENKYRTVKDLKGEVLVVKGGGEKQVTMGVPVFTTTHTASKNFLEAVETAVGEFCKRVTGDQDIWEAFYSSAIDTRKDSSLQEAHGDKVHN